MMKASGLDSLSTWILPKLNANGRLTLSRIEMEGNDAEKNPIISGADYELSHDVVEHHIGGDFSRDDVVNLRRSVELIFAVQEVKDVSVRKATLRYRRSPHACQRCCHAGALTAIPWVSNERLERPSRDDHARFASEQRFHPSITPK